MIETNKEICKRETHKILKKIGMGPERVRKGSWEKEEWTNQKCGGLAGEKIRTGKLRAGG
jgi:hypothetical protein